MHEFGDLWHFCYLPPRREGREPDLSSPRDMLAGACAQELLCDEGYRLTGVIFNHPNETPADMPDTKAFTSDAIVLLPTRPPMNDPETSDRKRINPSFTYLEGKLFAAASRWVAYSTRTEIKLTPEAAAISEGIARYRYMEFRQHGGPDINAYAPRLGERMSRPERHDPRTMGFLIRTQELWPGGPAAVIMWGPSAKATLVWAWQLKTKFRDLFRESSFLMGELRQGLRVSRPATMGPAGAWEVSILGAAPLDRSRPDCAA